MQFKPFNQTEQSKLTCFGVHVAYTQYHAYATYPHLYWNAAGNSHYSCHKNHPPLTRGNATIIYIYIRYICHISNITYLMPATVLTFACSVPIRIHQQLDASDSWEPTLHPTQPQSLRPIIRLPVEMSAVRKWKRATCPAHMYYFGSNVRRSEWVHYYKVYLWVNSCWFQAIDKHKLGADTGIDSI